MQAPASLLSAASFLLQLQPAFCGLFFFFPGQGWKKPGGSWPKGIFHPHWQQLLEHPCVLLPARCCPVATCCGAGTLAEAWGVQGHPVCAHVPGQEGREAPAWDACKDGGHCPCPPGAAVVLVTCAEVHTWTLSPTAQAAVPSCFASSAPGRKVKQTRWHKALCSWPRSPLVSPDPALCAWR